MKNTKLSGYLQFLAMTFAYAPNYAVDLEEFTKDKPVQGRSYHNYTLKSDFFEHVRKKAGQPAMVQYTGKDKSWKAIYDALNAGRKCVSDYHKKQRELRRMKLKEIGKNLLRDLGDAKPATQAELPLEPAPQAEAPLEPAPQAEVPLKSVGSVLSLYQRLSLVEITLKTLVDTTCKLLYALQEGDKNGSKPGSCPDIDKTAKGSTC